MAFMSTSNLNKTLNEQITSNASQSNKEDSLTRVKTCLIDDDDWIAVKSLSNSISKNNDIINTTNEIINIVSISVEKEKIAIVTREHNRLVTDDENTKQWYGIYSIEQLYSINQRMCELDVSLNDLYPNELRPIKGILSTYFTDKLKSDDLQDNDLCKSFAIYLNKAFSLLGKRLYIDILFNDIHSDQYFEIYSEFNLKRIQNQIDKIKSQLFPPKQTVTKLNSKQTIASINNKTINASLNELIKKQNEEHEQQQKLLLKQQLFSNLKHILSSYLNDDNHVENLKNLYFEYYNNLLKPLLDSLELAKTNLFKYKTKLLNQEKSSRLFSTQAAADALVLSRNHVENNKQEIHELSNNIDLMNIEYVQNLIDFNMKLLNKLKVDREKFTQPSLNLNMAGLFDILTKNRKEKIDEEISDKKLQLYNLQLNLKERKKETLNKEMLNDLNKQIIKIKMNICSEEEAVLKRKLNTLNGNENMELKETQLKALLNGSSTDSNCISEYKIEEIKEIISKIDLNNFADDYVHDVFEEEDEYDDSNFHDAYDDPLVLLQEEAKEKQEKNNALNLIKKKITEIGSKKSALRISMNKLIEADKAKQQELEAENESEKLSQTMVIKSAAIKKQEDELQRKENLENRKKALQRIREHKTKHLKDSLFSSTDSLASSSSTYTVNNSTLASKPLVRKQYVPKSKQRILPPPAKPRQSRTNKTSSSTNFNLKLNDLDESKIDENDVASSNLFTNKMMSDSEIFQFKPNIASSFNVNHSDIELTKSSTTQSSPPPPPPAPPLPPVIPLNTILPQPNIPPPPPPPPSFTSSATDLSANAAPPLPMTPLLFSTDMFKSEIKNAKTKQQKTTKSVEKTTNSNNKSFDINEIKNFKFKSSKAEKKERQPISQNSNPWDSLMNEIRSNAGGTKLKKISSSDKKSKHMKFNTNDQNSDSNLVRDLNQILSQRSQFFKEDDDDNESTDDESWNGMEN